MLQEALSEVAATDSLAFSLAAASLAAPEGGRASDAVLSLTAFNDAARALKRLGREDLLPRLAAQADACLDLVLRKMARKVGIEN